MNKIKKLSLALSTAFILTLNSPLCLASDTNNIPTESKPPIVLNTMGSLFFGGTVQTLPSGETFHGDHGPEKAHTYPLIMWHGIGQTGRSYESTPDGREGYMAIMPRRNWATYIIDQPRRGRAGRTLATLENAPYHPTTALESEAWNAFRNGVWHQPDKPYLFKGTQFPNSPDAVEQFFQQQAPDTGIEPVTAQYRAFMGHTMGELLKRTGPAILITHSNSGQYGWATGMDSPELIKAIVAYEPGSVIFPEGEELPELKSPYPELEEAYQPRRVSKEEFMKLTKYPIMIIYGDNISKKPNGEVFNVELWRLASTRAKQFVDIVNKYGGDATFVSLPDIGIKGNTHAPFADLNNEQIADQLEDFLRQKGLADYTSPHQGPKQHGLTEYTIPLDTNSKELN